MGKAVADRLRQLYYCLPISTNSQLLIAMGVRAL